MPRRRVVAALRRSLFLVLAIAALSPAHAVAAPGDLDPSWAIDGMAEFELGNVSPGEFFPTADGGAIVVTRLQGSPVDVGVTAPTWFRMKPDGTPDTDYGVRATDKTVEDNIFDVERLSTGKFVGLHRRSDGLMKVIRWNEDATRDLSFGGAGTGEKTFTFETAGGTPWTTALSIGTNDSIAVAGYVDTGSGGYPSQYPSQIVRLTSTGAFDDGFAGDGRLVVPASTLAFPGDVKVQPDGKVLMTGVGNTAGTDFSGVARFTATGAADPDFGGGDGLTTLPAINYGWLDTDLMSDGRIVMVGPGPLGDNDWSAARLLSTGAPDPAFGGGDGFTIVDVNTAELPLRAGAVQSDGKILIVGSLGSGSMTTATLVRLDAAGTGFDTTFSGDGMVSHGATVFPGSAAGFVDVAVVGGGARALTLGHQGNNSSAGTPQFLLGRYMTNSDAVPQASAQASPTSIDFGAVEMGPGVHRDVTLQNTGDAGLRVDDVNTTGAFATTGPCQGVLAPGASCVMDVFFNPTDTSPQSGSLVFTHNRGTTTVPLTGTGTEPGGGDPGGGDPGGGDPGGGDPGGGGPGGGDPGGGDPVFTPDPAFASIAQSPLLDALALPDFRPGSATCPKRKKARICTMADVQKILASRGLTNVVVAERAGQLKGIPKATAKLVRHGDVTAQSPDAPTPVTQPNLRFFHAAPGEVPVLFVYTFQHRQTPLKCGTADMATHLTQELKDWPGESYGSGNQRVLSAEALLKKKKCNYQVTYFKDGKRQSAEIDSAKGDPMKIKVALPKTLELSVTTSEGTSHPSKALAGLVSLAPSPSKNTFLAPRMPVTFPGLGGLVVRVTQTNTNPSVVVPGAVVMITDNDGKPVASGVTDSSGRAALTGVFRAEGRYTIVAQVVGDNGLTLDGEGDVRVRDFKRSVETVSGRRFSKASKNAKWKLLAPLGGASATIGSAQSKSPCQGHTNDSAAEFLAYGIAVSHDRLIVASTHGSDTQLAVGRLVNAYSAAQQLGLIGHRKVQDYLKRVKLEVSAMGAGTSPAIDGCEVVNLIFGQLISLTIPVGETDWAILGPRPAGYGFDIKKGALPVIESGGDMVLPDGTVVKRATSFTGPLIATPKFAPGTPRLSLDDRAMAVLGLLALEEVKTTQEMIDAIWGVIASGGGNVIASGGGNVIASGGGNLSEAQVKALFKVIASGGGNIINQDTGSFSPGQRDAVRKIISEAGGAIISEAGGALKSSAQLKALLGVIASGGGNLIGQAGTNLTAGQRDAVSAVIASGGGNVIASGGGNLLDAFQGVIASGGGNLTQGIVDGLAAVIASGGGNLIGQAGTNLTAKVAELMIRGGEVIASGGGNLIGQAGTNLAERMKSRGSFVATNGGTFVPTGSGLLIGQAGTNLIGQAGTN